MSAGLLSLGPRTSRPHQATRSLKGGLNLGTQTKWHSTQGGRDARRPREERARQSMANQNKTAQFVICINNGGYVDDLKVRTVYQLLPDKSAAKSNYIRIIDETGEDYLYPADLFAAIELPRELQKVLLTAS